MKKNNKHVGWQRVLLLILPYLFIVGLFQFIGALLAGIDLTQMNAEQTSIQQLTLSVFNLAGTFIVLWLFMRHLDKENFINMGLKLKNRIDDFIFGILAGLTIMILAYVVLHFLGEITFENINFNITEILISILLFSSVALLEEALMRGYILRNLMISFNKYIALIISSLLFSIMHGLNPNVDLFALTNIFIAGILLGVSYIHTKNLWFPIGLHLSWNLFQALLGFNVSGQNSYSLIEIKIKEKNILNGGDFGFEGSILSVIAMILLIIAIEFYYKRKDTTLNAILKSENE